MSMIGLVLPDVSPCKLRKIVYAQKMIAILFSYSKGYLNDDIISALKEDQLAKKFKTKLPLEIGIIVLRVITVRVF